MIDFSSTETLDILTKKAYDGTIRAAELEMVVLQLEKRYGTGLVVAQDPNRLSNMPAFPETPKLPAPVAKLNTALCQMLAGGYAYAGVTFGLHPEGGAPHFVVSDRWNAALPVRVARDNIGGHMTRLIEQFGVAKYLPRIYGAFNLQAGICAWCGRVSQSELFSPRGPLTPTRDTLIRFTEASLVGGDPLVIQHLGAMLSGPLGRGLGNRTAQLISLWGICAEHEDTGFMCQECRSPFPAWIASPVWANSIILERRCGHCTGSGLVNVKPPKPGLAELRAFHANFAIGRMPKKR